MFWSILFKYIVSILATMQILRQQTVISLDQKFPFWRCKEATKESHEY